MTYSKSSKREKELLKSQQERESDLLKIQQERERRSYSKSSKSFCLKRRAIMGAEAVAIAACIGDRKHEDVKSLTLDSRINTPSLEVRKWKKEQ